MSFMIGVDEGRGLVFEGDSNYGAHLVWPVPVMTPAQFSDSSAKEFAGFQSGGAVTYYFREDMFDPVSRIRRGRFYKYSGRSGSWTVLPVLHITIPRMAVDRKDGLLSVPSLADYQACVISGELNNLGIAHAVVVLGKGKSSTIWSIIHIETSFTGEEMVTLKARQSLGALPEINWSKVPVKAESTVREKLSVLEDEYHRAGAESVVDRAREAATAILSGYLQERDITIADGQDLGRLIELLAKNSGKHEQRVVACAAEIPQRMHSRAKHAEQEKRVVRSIRVQDAELAVQCIGVMLCDLGWAEWR
jgi:hypothetical protein